MNELEFQSRIVKATIAGGGFARKLSSRFLVGVPDLYVKLPRLRGVFIECKYGKCPIKADKVLVDLTVPQRRFLMGAHKAGDHAMVLSMLMTKNRDWLLRAWRIDEFPEDKLASVDLYLNTKKAITFISTKLHDWERPQ